MKEHSYIACDLKSYYGSAECVARGLDPLTTNLVVADLTRTEKTICLAVTPPLKAVGVPGRPRLFEVVEKVKEINSMRRVQAPGHHFTGESSSAPELAADPSLALAYIVAPPRMKYYMDLSAKIYQIYLKYIAPEDIHVYSVDEVFMDVTNYLDTYGLTPRELAMKMIQDVLAQTGITATAGIGTNLYLCKVAMDIVAKHIPADKDGVRIAELDERSYREKLWDHRPITDFWRVGRGYARRLEKHGLYTMGDIALCSVGRPSDYYNEALLYKEFGINAELLIDHAWGWENCTMADIKAYRPESHSLSSGQVLSRPYSFQEGRLIVREMTDLLVLDLVDKGLVTDQMALYVGYDSASLATPAGQERYRGPVARDYYGKPVPKPAHSSINLSGPTASSRTIIEAVTALYERIVNPGLLVRRINVVANHVICEDLILTQTPPEQLNLFTDYGALEKKQAAEQAAKMRERNMQRAMLEIRRKFGKNAILKGMNLEEAATARERNRQVGGHRA